MPANPVKRILASFEQQNLVEVSIEWNPQT